MGLDGIVFKNIKNIDFLVGEEFAKIDSTGEVYFENVNMYNHYPSTYFEATSERLGNVSEIAYLRTIVKKNTLLYKFFLSDSNEFQDKLEFERLDELESELNSSTTQLSSRRDLALNKFISKVTRLVTEAKLQHNPIVLV